MTETVKQKDESLCRGKYSLPLYIQLKQNINRRINSGEYSPGAMIPSEARFVEEYGVSRITVQKALDELENEGLVSRVHGKGTFVETPALGFSSERIVGVVMHTKGHLYEALSGEIIKQLQEHEYFCVVLNCQPMEDDEEELQKLGSLIDRNPSFLIAHGYVNFPFSFLERYEGRIIFVNVFDSARELEADYVLSDYYAGGRLAAGHLLGRGVERFVCYMRNFYRSPASKKHILKGATDFLREKGVPDAALSVVKGESEDELLTELDAMEKPLAVICDSDEAAKPVYRYARERGLSIPEDISVTGYYNTPWCGFYEPSLTSVSVREDVIAEKVAGRVIDSKPECEKILIEPKIIVRES